MTELDRSKIGKLTSIDEHQEGSYNDVVGEWALKIKNS